MNTNVLEQDWDSDMFASGSLIDWSEFSAEHALKFPGTHVGLIEEFREPYRFGENGPMRFASGVDLEDDDPE
ncbi:MAG: hypothetical protein ABI771_10740 [Betaproteobacteria bacterium]